MLNEEEEDTDSIKMKARVRAKLMGEEPYRIVDTRRQGGGCMYMIGRVIGWVFIIALVLGLTLIAPPFAGVLILLIVFAWIAKFIFNNRSGM